MTMMLLRGPLFEVPFCYKARALGRYCFRPLLDGKRWLVTAKIYTILNEGGGLLLFKI